MTQPPVDPVPSIPEAEATGATKAIYEDFKAVTGVPVVNLIFRHIATLPGCLAWSWEVLRPLYASGAVATYATHLMDDLETPTVPHLPRAALRAVGVDALGESAINRILDAYNRSNPMNLVALTTLLTYLADPDQAIAAATPAAPLQPVRRPSRQRSYRRSSRCTTWTPRREPWHKRSTALALKAKPGRWRPCTGNWRIGPAIWPSASLCFTRCINVASFRAASTMPRRRPRR